MIASTGAVSRSDRRLLRVALALAARGGLDVHPNPRVGALVVGAAEPDVVVGRGHHRRYGGPHAEPEALAEAGVLARGGTLYCTLEPCSFDAPDKHQPPCTRAIIAAGIERVVIGRVDPHPRVRGDGLRQLRDAGIRVDIARDPLPFWLVDPVNPTVLSFGRPFVHAVTAADIERPREPAIVYEAAATPASTRRISPATRSVLLRCDDPAAIGSLDGLPIDFVDGRPTKAWQRQVRATVR